MFSIFFIFRVKEVNMKIDGIDKKIIRSLIEDARTPILSIAREVGISGAAIHQRLRKLEKARLFDGYHLKINHESIGYSTTSFVGLYLEPTTVLSSAIKRLKEIPEVVESHYTTGKYPVFIKILCKNNQDLIRILETKIQQINGVSKIETFISLQQQIDRQIHI